MDYTLASKAAEQAIIDDILGSDRAVNAALYQAYANNLRRAIDRVFAQDDGSGLSDRLRANVSRFAAYKAYHATRLARQAAAEPDGDPQRVLHTFNRYQAAEYNTTVSRCRTAKQWGEFADADHMRLFPNLRWLPSRSATPREEHVRFYNRVWAKTDPFWQQNQPGNLWNCKCDWEETDDPCTAANPTTPIRHNGLEGNPALTGQVFTDNHAYFAKCSKAQQKKLTHYIGDKILRSESKQSLHKIQGSTVVIDKQGEKIEVLFDSKTTSHLSNDIAQSLQFIWNELADKLPQILSKSKLIGREINVKRDKKPWAEEYFYYEYKTQYNTLYFSVEYNNNPLKNRQFYRLYSITSKLRNTAIIY